MMSRDNRILIKTNKKFKCLCFSSNKIISKWKIKKSLIKNPYSLKHKQAIKKSKKHFIFIINDVKKNKIKSAQKIQNHSQIFKINLKKWDFIFKGKILGKPLIIFFEKFYFDLNCATGPKGSD